MSRKSRNRLLEQTQLQIQEELTSLTLYDDVAPTLSALKAHEIPIAICSNLASPYRSVLVRLLANHRFIRCTVGAIACGWGCSYLY